MLVERVAVQRDQGMPALEDEGVHDVAHRLTARFLQRVPKVGGDRVGVGVGLEVRPHAVPEDLGPDVLLEHPQHGTALFVGQEVEHPLGLLGRADRVLDRPGGVHAVDGQRRLAGGGEPHPAVPRRPEGVDAEGLHEGGEGLVEPDPLPPAHGHQVAEPHVRQLVGDDVGHPLQLGPGRAGRVDQQRGVPERDATQVLHGAGGEVRNGDEVHLLPGVRDVEVLREEAQREGADGQGEIGQLALARGEHHAQGDPVDVDRLGRLQLAHDEGDQVGRHLHGGGEAHDVLVAHPPHVHDRGVGEGIDVPGDGERDLEDGLAVGLVPARKGPAGVDRLELGGGDGVEAPRVIGEGGAVEAP